MNNPNQVSWYSSWLVKLSIALHVVALVSVLILPVVWPWALMVILINHLIVVAVGLWPRSHWLGSNWTRLPIAAAQRNEVALTIDDGPDPLVTPQVLDILERHCVKATFFCIGKKAIQQAELCREIVRRGHAVENHSQHHRLYFSLLGTNRLVTEIEAGQKTISGITGETPQFFRAPAGLRNPFLEPALKRFGLQLATWSVRAFDTKVGDADKVKSKLSAGLHAGAILLLHDGNSARTKMGIPVILTVLPALLETAKQRNLQFVTLRDAAI
jgi:peptidoglycan/xylan/chitin deacetylase (PgdA/CDA1 family)